MNVRKIRLSTGQKRKLRTSYRKRRGVVISLKKEQLSGGGDNVMLTDDQNKAVIKSMKNNKGLRLLLSFEQLMKNTHGGLLKELLEKAEAVVPLGKSVLSPLVKKRLAPLLRDRFVPWLKQLIDSELDTIIERDPKGAGFKRHINRKLDIILSTALKKRPTSNRCRCLK